MAREQSGGLFRVKCRHCDRHFLANKKSEAEKARNAHEKSSH